MKPLVMGWRYYFRSILLHRLRSFYILIGLNFLGQIRGKESYLMGLAVFISMLCFRHSRPNCSSLAVKDIFPFLKGKNVISSDVHILQSREYSLLVLLIESREILLSPKRPESYELFLLPNSLHISCFSD